MPVFALDARSGSTVTIAKGEVVDGDLYVAGRTVIVDGTINGDFWACGRAITVNGIVRGGVVALGEMILIRGDVGRSVRAAGRILTIGGSVDGDVVVGASRVHVTRAAGIENDLVFGARKTRVDGPVGGSISGGGGEVTLSNEVKGDVKLRVERLALLPTTDVQGDLTYTSEQEADIQSGAQIAGETTHKLPEVREKRGRPFPGVVGRVIGFLMALLAGLLVILLAPTRLKSIAETLRTRPGPSAGWGAIVLCATPVAVLIACITIVGIPVGLIALACYGIVIYLSQIPVGFLIGQWIIAYFKGVESRAMMFGALALGLVILRLLRLIPYLGFFIGLAIILFGLGAIGVSEWRRNRGIREVTPA